MQTYHFHPITSCNMCGQSNSTHKVLGQRLNKSQGFRPRKKVGISVSIQQCSNCGLIYSNPLPVPASLQDHYGTPAEDYWKPEYFTWSPTYFAHQINEAKQLLPFAEGMKALDIGAGLGKAMLSMEHAGFETYGMEPSVPFHKKAISEMGVNAERLKLGAIEELDYAPNTFDFITFGAVYEHLYDPNLCMQKAMTWLKPGGILHAEVPSSKWLMPKIMNFYFRLIGTNYVTNLSPMHTPFHLHEFTEKSFEELGKKIGYTIEKRRTEVCSIYFVPKIFHPLLRWYMKTTQTGMQLTVYLRKNG
jgi:2-polyprenyl-3-methyl-5-hydroxy-6-metoxy-1,4-benzoquinol methylase